jgi:phage tail sheath protein FI
MSATTFLHGVEVDEVASATQPISFNPSGVVGLIGTASLADEAAFPLNEAVLLNSQPTQALKLGAEGTLLSAVQQIYAEGAGQVVVVRVADAVDPDTTMSNIIGSAAAKTGLYAFLGARALVGVPPRTLIAPGFTSILPTATGGGPLANPIVTAALPLATRLRGRVYIDAPSTGDADALAAAELYSSDRAVIFYPSVMVWDTATSAYVQLPASASMAGLTAYVHENLGFWFSPSNQPLQGVGGVSTPIDWAMSDAECEANTLNAASITTIINAAQSAGLQYGGFRRWGNRNLATDTNWRFEAVRTALDMVYEALDEVTLWAVDKPPGLQLLQDMANRANDFFKWGKTVGFLVGGRCWLDPELNPAAQCAQGIWNWSIDPEAPAPMEHIIYTASRNASYYTQEVAALANMISANG